MILFAGPTAQDGQSAYEIAVANGYVGTEVQWLADLQGAAGLSAYQIAVANGYTGTEQAWIASLHGAAGLSAYQIAVANGFFGTQSQWVASLQGPAGPPGNLGNLGVPQNWTPAGPNVVTASSKGQYVIIGKVCVFSAVIYVNQLYATPTFPAPIKYGLQGLDVGFTGVLTPTNGPGQTGRLFCDENSAGVLLKIEGPNLVPQLRAIAISISYLTP